MLQQKDNKGNIYKQLVKPVKKIMQKLFIQMTFVVALICNEYIIMLINSF